jgi:hypothetical protein
MRQLRIDASVMIMHIFILIKTYKAVNANIFRGNKSLGAVYNL